MSERRWIPCVLCGEGPGQVEVALREGNRIVRCGGCGLRFINPQPTVDELLEFYGSTYFESAPDKFHTLPMVPAVRRRLDDYVDQVIRHGGGGRLLDVGCGTGFFIVRCRRQGVDAVGIDLSPAAARFGREELGLDVKTGQLRDVEFEQGGFDTITMWDCLEHTLEPLEELLRVRHLLKPGGRLFVCVPNSGGLLSRISGSRWIGYDKVPEHVFYYTERTLRRILTAAGFEVLALRPQKWICELEWVLRKGDRIHGPTARLLLRLGDRLGLLQRVVAVPALNLFAAARAPG